MPPRTWTIFALLVASAGFFVAEVVVLAALLVAAVLRLIEARRVTWLVVAAPAVAIFTLAIGSHRSVFHAALLVWGLTAATVVARLYATATQRAAGVQSMSAPRPAPARTSSGAENAVIGVFAVIAGIWHLLVGALIVAGIGAFLWGGTNGAHERCLAHRFGAPGLLNSVACVVEH